MNTVGKRITAVIVIALGIVALVLVRQINRSRVHEVVLIFPDGFRGTAKIRAKQREGIVIRLSNNVYTIAFSTSGVVNVQGSLPTLKWHQLRARYSDGRTLPIVEPEQSVSDNEIALRSLGVSEGRVEDWYAVGTSEDAKKGLTEKWGFWPKIGPGSQ